VIDRRAVALAGHTGDVATAEAGLASSDGHVRAAALGALERLGLLDDDRVRAAFGDPDPVVRRRAVTIAARHLDIDLLGPLRDPDQGVVEVAAWAAGEHERVSDEELATLVELAGEADDPLVREAAVAALGAIGDDRGLEAILAATADRPAIRRRAVLALAPFVAPDHTRAGDVASALARATADRDWQVRQAAEDVSGQSGNL
jgi:HEAT repeat protein